MCVCAYVYLCVDVRFKKKQQHVTVCMCVCLILFIIQRYPSDAGQHMWGAIDTSGVQAWQVPFVDVLAGSYTG